MEAVPGPVVKIGPSTDIPCLRAYLVGLVSGCNFVQNAGRRCIGHTLDKFDSQVGGCEAYNLVDVRITKRG